MASNDIVDLDVVKDWLGIDESDTSRDAILDRLISVATDKVTQTINYSPILGARVEYISGRNRTILPVSNLPIVSIESLMIDDVAIPARTSATGPGYTFDEDFIYLTGYVATNGMRNVLVNYHSGYDPVPEVFQQAACLIIQSALGYQGKEGGVTSISLPGVISQSMQPIGDVDVPAGVKQMLKRFVREYAP